jgi:hypothetical protein
MNVWFLLAIALLPLFGVYLAGRVPAVWSGAPSPLAGIPTVYLGTARRTFLLFVLAWHAAFDGMFLLFLGMELDIAAIWQVGTVVMVFGTPLVVLLWIIVAITNWPKSLVPPDQRKHRVD